MRIKDLDKDTVNKILWEIAMAYPFSFDAVRSAFGDTQSFDATIRACETAVDLGFTSPVQVIGLMRPWSPEKSVYYTPVIPRTRR